MELNEVDPVKDEVIGAPEDGSERPVDPAHEQEWLRAAALVAAHGETPEADLPELIDLEVEQLREARDEGPSGG
jgi:hypothetical protein